MVDALDFRLCAPGLTAERINRIVDALEAEALLVPTHASPDERMRVPYDGPAIRSALSRERVEIWRTTRPRYTGSISTNSHAKDGVHFVLEEPDPASLESLFGAATRLAAQVRPEWGFVHMRWRLGEKSEAYNAGTLKTGRDLDRFGIPGVYARTWFGPYLTQLISKEFLLARPYASETTWGGVQLDLVSKPWSATFEQLSAQQAEVLQRLQARGVVGTFKGPSVRWKAGPGWRSPGWDPLRKKRSWLS
jgi:hypothetical protein